jgi:hypothetical protein
MRFFFLIFILCFKIIICYGQFQIKFPLERSVFQRVNNISNFQILGNSDVYISKLQIKLTAINNGEPIEWLTIAANMSPGKFHTEIKAVKSGWKYL